MSGEKTIWCVVGWSGGRSFGDVLSESIHLLLVSRIFILCICGYDDDDDDSMCRDRFAVSCAASTMRTLWIVNVSSRKTPLNSVSFFCHGTREIREMPQQKRIPCFFSFTFATLSFSPTVFLLLAHSLTRVRCWEPFILCVFFVRKLPYSIHFDPIVFHCATRNRVFMWDGREGPDRLKMCKKGKAPYHCESSKNRNRIFRFAFDNVIENVRAFRNNVTLP